MPFVREQPLRYLLVVERTRRQQKEQRVSMFYGAHEECLYARTRMLEPVYAALIAFSGLKLAKTWERAASSRERRGTGLDRRIERM